MIFSGGNQQKLAVARGYAQNYDLFIPINKKVGTVKKYVVQAISEITDGLIVEKESLKDFENSFLVSKEIKMDDYKNFSLAHRFSCAILRIFAPLL